MSSHLNELNASYHFPQLQTPYADEYPDGRTTTSGLAGTSSTPLEVNILSGSGSFSPQVLLTSGESVDGENNTNHLTYEFLDSLGLPSAQQKAAIVSIPSSRHPS
jgi:hypothetical protein